MLDKINRNYKLEMPSAIKPKGVSSTSAAEATTNVATTKSPSRSKDEVKLSEIPKFLAGPVDMLGNNDGTPAFRTIADAANKLRYDGNVCVDATEKLAKEIYSKIKEQYA